MRFVRYKKRNEIKYGLLKDKNVLEIRGDIFSRFEVTSVEHSKDTLEILSPINPSKIIAIGLNYIDHAKELDMVVPDEPLFFLKPNTSIIGNNDKIILPKIAERVDFEAELAIIVGKKARNISIDDAESYIFGYTCANDITARDLQKKDGQWTRAKSFDTFCPLGPYIVSDLDPHGLDIECLVNGVVKQKSNTRKMIFKPDELLSFVSQVMTLLPGDVIITGTPPGVDQLMLGDTVEVRIDKVGSLINKVGVEK